MKFELYFLRRAALYCNAVHSKFYSVLYYSVFVWMLLLYCSSSAQSRFTPTIWSIGDWPLYSGPSTWLSRPGYTLPGTSFIDVSQWNRGSGCSFSYARGRYETQGFIQPTAADALNQKSYFYFTITNNNTTAFRITSFTGGTGQRSLSGPTEVALYHKMSGTSSPVLIGSSVLMRVGYAVDQPSFTPSDPIVICPGMSDTFYYCYYGASSRFGTYGIESGQALIGTWVNGPTTIASSLRPVVEGSSIHFTSVASSGVAGYTYAWSGPSGYTSGDAAPSIRAASLLDAGIYTLTVTDAWGCKVSDTALVIVTPIASGCTGAIEPGVSSAATVRFCDSGSTILRTVGATIGYDIVYNWQSSSDSVSWSNIRGAESVTYTTPRLYATTYYRMRTYCYSTGVYSTANCIKVAVHNTPIISVASSTPTFCSGGPGVSLIATGAGSSGIYTWSPSLGLSSSNGATVTVNSMFYPITYTVTGTSAISNCTSTGVFALGYTQVSGSVSPMNVSICGEPGQLLTPTAIVYPLPPQNFESALATYGWTKSGDAPWTQKSYNCTIGATILINPRGNAKLYVVEGTTITSSYLSSPSFSLEGLSSASVNYEQFYDEGVGFDSANVAISVDGGTNWRLLYKAVNNWFSSSTYDLTNYTRTISLDAYLGQPNVKIRFGYFKYGAASAFFYALDNVTISGTPMLSRYTWLPTEGLSTTTGCPRAIPAATTVYTASVSGCVIAKDTITVVPRPILAGSFTATPAMLCPLDTLRLNYLGSSTGVGAGTPLSYTFSGPDGFRRTTDISLRRTYAVPTSAVASGVYSCSVTYSGIGCISVPITSGAVDVHAPMPYNVTGGVGCGVTGVVVGLTHSDTGIYYQLYNRSTAVGAPILGTGVAMVFNGGVPITTEGVYYVRANNGYCSQLMNDSAIVYNELAVCNVLGNGVVGAAGCSSTGLVLSLGSSQIGVVYQLFRDTFRVDAPRVGNGSALVFNVGVPYTLRGRYRVVATLGGCSSTMSNAIHIYDSVITYNLTNSHACTLNGMRLGLSGSDTGVLYTVFLNKVSSGLGRFGQGSRLLLDSFNTLGRYTVVASASGGCTKTMRGYATLFGAPSYTPVASAAHICAAPGSSIAVSSGTITLLNESFESPVEDRGWTVTASSPTWGIVTSPFIWPSSSISNSADGTKFILIDGRVHFPAISYLTSPIFSLEGLSTATVSFKYFFDQGYVEQVTLELSSNGGYTWSEALFTASNHWFSSRDYNMTAASVSLTAYIGQPNVRLRLKYNTSGVASYFFAADDFKVTGTPSPSSYFWSPAEGLSSTRGATVVAIPSVTTVYTVSLTNCPSTIGSTATINVYPLPHAGRIVATPSNYCIGTGSILLSDAATISGPAGAAFTAYNWSGPAGYSSSSITNSATLRPESTAASGRYSVSVTYSYPGCTSTPLSSDSIAVNLGIVSYAMTGRDSCAYLGGVFGLDTTTRGDFYVLWRNSTALDTIMGSGSALVFDTQRIAGLYTIHAFNAGGCTGNMLRSVRLYNDGTIYAVTGGIGCSSTGLNIGLDGSQNSKNYQLLRNGIPFGSIIAGTGRAISFGLITDTGLYHVLATNIRGVGCASLMSGHARIGYTPMGYHITGGRICSATGSLHVGVGSSELGVLYQLYRNDTALSILNNGTGSVLSFGDHNLPGYYRILATGSRGCTSFLFDSAIMYTSPACTLGDHPIVCQGTTRASISLSGLVGGPAEYSIYWDAIAADSGFVGVVAAVLSDTIRLVIPAGIVGTYHGVIVLHNTHCNSTSYRFSVQILPIPAASITEAMNPCLRHTARIAIAGTSGDEISYSISEGLPISATLAGGIYNYITSPIVAATSFRLIEAHNIVCATTIDTTIYLAPTPNSWIGGTIGAANNWNTATNWSCGWVPTITDSVMIPNGCSFMPILGSYATSQVGALAIGAGATIELEANATLKVARSFVNNGSIQGVGAICLNGNYLQPIQGIGAVRHLLISNHNGAIIDSFSRISIKASLGLQRGNLYTNDSLVLNSDELLTARVLPLPDSCRIIGKASVMQYIPGGRRAFRFWAHPFNHNMELSQLQPYIDITGPGGSVNGFITTGSNAPSAFRYNPLVSNAALGSDPGWMRMSSVFGSNDSNRWHTYQGLRIFYRGSKGEGLGYITSYTPSSTTVAFKGLLNQGTQVLRLSKGVGDAQDYNMVGNPFASPIDIGTIVHEAKRTNNVVGAAYYIWNPYLATVGQYQAIPVNTMDATPYYLQANASFQVRAAHHNDSLIIRESHKVGVSTTSLLKIAENRIILHVLDRHNHLWDALHIAFNEDATSEVDDDYDALKLLGPDFNLYALTPTGKRLAIATTTIQGDSVIALGWHSNYQQQFVLRAAEVTTLDGRLFYLHDKVLNTYMLLQQGAIYTFQAKASEREDNRFEIVWRHKCIPEGIEWGIELSPNPAKGDAEITWTKRQHSVCIMVQDIHGVILYRATVVGASLSHKLPTGTWPSGAYIVHFTEGGNKVVRTLIKQ